MCGGEWEAWCNELDVVEVDAVLVKDLVAALWFVCDVRERMTYMKEVWWFGDRGV